MFVGVVRARAEGDRVVQWLEGKDGSNVKLKHTTSNLTGSCGRWESLSPALCDLVCGWGAAKMSVWGAAPLMKG